MTIEAKTGEARGMDNAAMLDTAFLYGANAAYIEQLYAQYAEDPSSVPESWQRFFRGVADTAADATKAAKGPEWKEPLKHQNGELVSALDGNWATEAKPAPKKAPQVGPTIAPADLHQQVQDSIRAIMMIRAYRMRGHLAANLDPLHIAKQEEQPELDPRTYGFGPKDMDRRIYIDNVLGLEYATPRQMLDILKRTYCGTFAVEFMHISDPDEKSWLQQRIEGKDKEIHFTPQGKRAILKKLVEAEAFERFLHKRYPGTKRFGLDGGEAAVPALEQIIKRGGALGADEIIIGMPHRGRLNVLAAVMGKPYHKIFFEFQGGNTQGGDDYGSGDVKYHLGASSDREFDGHKVHLSLTANPSHLEIVNPVVLGKARAKQFFDEVEAGATRATDPKERNMRRTKVMPLLLHGEVTDASIDIFDREQAFLDRILLPLTQRFPGLRIVLEHITTAQSAQFVREAGPQIAATITAHHLLFNRTDMLAGGVRPHLYCLPILKRSTHQQALIEAATSGNPRFFLGTDSAPHSRHLKEHPCGCAGCFTAHAALELYAEAFEQAGALDKLEGFASFHGADFYGLPRHRDTITLVREAWTVPASYPFGPSEVVPVRAGETVAWRVQP